MMTPRRIGPAVRYKINRGYLNALRGEFAVPASSVSTASLGSLTTIAHSTGKIMDDEIIRALAKALLAKLDAQPSAPTTPAQPPAPPKTPHLDHLRALRAQGQSVLAGAYSQQHAAALLEEQSAVLEVAKPQKPAPKPGSLTAKIDALAKSGQTSHAAQLRHLHRAILAREEAEADAAAPSEAKPTDNSRADMFVVKPREE